MTRAELFALLERLDLHPSRKLGQNFLLDQNMLNALIEDACVQEGERILEIGPGLGVLTRAMLDRGCDLTSVELDHRLADYIRSEFGGRCNFRLVQGDAVKQDYDKLMGSEPYRCVANLPYSCSTPFLSNIASACNPPRELCVLLQKEMAERLIAGHGTKDYGLPTVKLALRYRTRILRTVPPGVFFPPPEVTSAFVKLEFRQLCSDEKLRRTVENIAAAAFSQRRKKAATLISPLFPESDMGVVFASVGLREDMRADGISVAAYIALAKKLLGQ